MWYAAINLLHPSETGATRVSMPSIAGTEAWTDCHWLTASVLDDSVMHLQLEMNRSVFIIWKELCVMWLYWCVDMCQATGICASDIITTLHKLNILRYEDSRYVTWRLLANRGHRSECDWINERCGGISVSSFVWKLKQMELLMIHSVTWQLLD